MIPSDLAARLRTLTEASFFDSEPPIQGTAKVREIQARLPQLLPGQPFTATLQRPLPDGTFQAIVAGRSYTLALSHAAKAGDTLELVVTRNTPNAVFAQLAGPAAGAAAAADASRPQLSATGRLISFLLTGQPAPQPATLAAAKPLLNAPPANGATLAPLLRQALSQSGLFYESHQLQWLSGKFDAASLLKEPQGQHGPQRPAGALPGQTAGMQAAGALAAGTQAAGAPGAGAPGAAAPAAGPQAQPGATPGPAGATPAQPGAGAAGPAVRGLSGAGATGESSGSQAERAGDPQQATSATRAATVPDRLIPVVHQQLDALATQQYVVHAHAWPGQTVEWLIEDSERDGGGDESEQGWNTTLRLTMPRLGSVEARLHLTPAGIALRLVADDEPTVAALQAAHDQLDEALAAAGVPLTGFVAEPRRAEA